MKWWKWLTVLIPVAIGLGVDLVLVRTTVNIPVLYTRVDLATLVLLFSLFLTGIYGLVMLFLEWVDRREEHQVHEVQLAANDERRRFLRRLDHELKNPLTAIRAGLANISETDSSEDRQEALTSVDAQALRLSRLAADLRKLAELETRPVEHTPVDMAILLQEAFSLTQDQPESENRHLSLTLPQVPWPLPKVSGDQDLLILAVHNLLDNALKFTRPGDSIEVRAFEDGANVVIEVADTGPGIQEEDISHVWEELYRGQGAQGVPGSGLGLALVRAIAERHNGLVNLRSRAGQGTVFTLRLPVG
jgi:two-component system OmpR family sensor kinase